MGNVSPFAPANPLVLPPVDGVRLAACEAGIRYAGRTDLLLALFEPSTAVAGVFTTSKTASAAVDWCREHLSHGMARALVVNSGNANAFTGMKGREAVTETVRATSRIADCLEADVYVASTGVIGEPLDPSKFVGSLAGLADRAQADGYEMAARAIMTTDTFPKLATREPARSTACQLRSACAEERGMIAPDMATMLYHLHGMPIEPCNTLTGRYICPVETGNAAHASTSDTSWATYGASVARQSAAEKPVVAP